MLVECLVREGVDVVFAYPGGASMPIHQALSHQPKIRTILRRHEQGGAFGAEGYGRVTGKVGVCISTSGPGATNMITSIADAYLDSTPLVAITAQVMRSLIGRGAFQETDVFGMTAPIVKHSYLVTEPEELPRIIKEAFYIASTGRPGPVLIDMPKDVQEAVFTPDFDMEMDIPGYNPVLPVPADKLEELIPLIENARRPVIYAGGGIISAEASGDLLEFAERSQIPVATTLMGIGAMPETHPLSLRWLGMHGAVFANNAVNEADLVIALGARFDDRVTGAVNMFCPESTIVHIDIDASEINKNKKVAYPIRANVKDALRVLNSALAAKGWELHYVLSFTAYSEEPEPGEYWGQVALIAFAPRYTEEFNVFLKAFAKAAGDGLRPDPKLSNDSIVSVLANPAEWKPSSKIKIPRGGGRTAILKDHRSVHDSMLDAARSKKVGCYIVSWAFILAVVTLVVWALHKFGLF